LRFSPTTFVSTLAMVSLEKLPSCLFHVKLKHQDIEFEVAAFGNYNDSTKRTLPPARNICSWVNGAKTIDEGSHVKGMLSAFEAVNWQPELMLIHVIMHNPEYAGPFRSALDAPYVEALVQAALTQPLSEHCQVDLVMNR
jgi:DNA gyrase subunit B